MATTTMSTDHHIMMSRMSNGGAGPPASSAAVAASTSTTGTSSSSSIANYSPISTLEKQYKNAANNNRILIAVHCSPECCTTTLDDVLKARRPPPGGGTVVGKESSTIILTDPDPYNNDPNIMDGTSTTVPNGSSNNDGTNGADISCGDDPFSFLHNSTSSNDPTAGARMEDTTTTTSKRNKKPNLGRFLKKVAVTSTKVLERGMHQLAVRADQGRSPDCLVLAAFDSSNNGNGVQQLLHVTEAEPLLPNDNHHRTNGLQFRIPLAIPDNNNNNNSVVVLKLYIRSGAALVSSKYYHLATTTTPLNVTQLRQQLVVLQKQQQQQHAPSCCTFLKVPVNSPYFVNGTLQCTVVPDPKFPPLHHRGWFLQDPNPATAYSSTSSSSSSGGMLSHYWPLDQSYCFALSSSGTKTKTLWATERTVESTLVLPVATAWAQLVASACRTSYHHCCTVSQSVLEYRHDHAAAAVVGTTTTTEYADVNINISHFQPSSTSSTNMMMSMSNQAATVSVNFQRPNSIFEVEILPATKLPLHNRATTTTATATTAACPDISCRFYPKPVRQGILPSLLQQIPGGQLAPGAYLLGSARIEITVPKSKSDNNNSNNGVTPENPFDPSPTTPSVSSSSESWNCIIPLERLGRDDFQTREYPVYNHAGHCMGSVVLSITFQMIEQQQQQPVQANTSAAGGLVALVGMSNVLDGVLPPLDFDSTTTSAAAQAAVASSPELQRRRSQLSTMGHFVTHAYLDQHLKVRKQDLEMLEERAAAYQAAIGAAMTGTTTSSQIPPVPAHQVRTPKPFRPSSSRTTTLLSGIGFNVHTASFSLDVLDPSASAGGGPPPGNTFYNITCGAPADHARGFGNVFSDSKEKSSSGSSKAAAAATATGSFNSPIGPASGGLRRLRAARRQLAEEITNQQTALVMSITNYFVEERQKQSAAAAGGVVVKPVTHVPALNAELQGMRWRIFEAVQCLHHLTWACAMRQASVFSQALGIAVSSYLSSLSDPMKLQSSWPELWVQHGFLVSYEGLLSAAGKELGMIEDASVGIDMLRMVRIILVPDDGSTNASRVPVPHSTYIRWIHLWTVPTPAPATGHEVEYILQIGMVPSYFEQRIPPPLKAGTGVRLYPLLFEVGVDIFQAASNAGSNMSKNMTSSTGTTYESETQKVVGGLIEDEDDDVGITDNDVLVQLNYEAFQKMNTYAQSVSPAAPIQATPTRQTHPLLATLFQHIVSSSGKMNHDILDEAANLAQQLGGGGVVFCKSGKDRTAMHVTYKQAQFTTRFRERSDPSRGQGGDLSSLDGMPSTVDSTLEDAMLIRLYGTRLPICEKNVGQAKYAFNALQVKFMPEALKPPMSALAGFLKGGKVFGGGGIES